MAIRRILVECWVPKVTNTQSEYVIPVAFRLQQWSYEHMSLLCYTHIVLLVFLLRVDRVSLCSDLLRQKENQFWSYNRKWRQFQLSCSDYCSELAPLSRTSVYTNLAPQKRILSLSDNLSFPLTLSSNSTIVCKLAPSNWNFKHWNARTNVMAHYQERSYGVFFHPKWPPNNNTLCLALFMRNSRYIVEWRWTEH